MIRIFGILTCTLMLNIACGQPSKLMKTYGLTKRIETVVLYQEGNVVSNYTKEIKRFDKNGKWIERHIYSDQGELKAHDKRIFKKGEIIEEERIDFDGVKAKEAEPPSHKKKTYEYEKGNLMVERFLNKDGEVKRVKEYTYNQFGDESDIVTRDANGELIKKVLLEYDARGLKTKETLIDSTGKIGREQIFLYE